MAVPRNGSCLHRQQLLLKLICWVLDLAELNYRLLSETPGMTCLAQMLVYQANSANG